MKAEIINWGFAGTNRYEMQKDPFCFPIHCSMTIADVRFTIRQALVFRTLHHEVIDALLDEFFLIRVARLTCTAGVANAIKNDKGTNGDLCVYVKVTY
jgi:hypothetical protein